MVAKRSSRALALLLALPSASFALGLGDIRLLSPLNAPLDAEIELVDVTSEELQSLQAQIASRDTFSRYGLEFPVFLSGVQVRTVRNPDGKEVIKLKSTESITEPFLTLLVEVNWARGRLVREYTMLLDPPVFTPGQADKPALANAPVAPPASGAGTREGAIARSATSPPPAPSPPPAETMAAVPSDSSTTASAEPSPGMAAPPAPEATPAAPPAPAPSPAASSSAMAGNSHVVTRGETLSQIATGVTGTRRNSPQAHVMMLAIYQANPSAFEKNMNLLRSGAVLRIPDNADVAAVSPSEAAAEIRRQYAAWRGSSAPSGASSAKSGELRLVTPTEQASAGAGGSAPGEVKALQSRVHDLEGQLNDSKRLLEMRNAELSDLQSRLATAQKGGQAAPAPEPAAPEPSAAAPAPAEPPVAQTEQRPETAAAPAPAEEPPAQAAEAAQPPMAANTPPPPRPTPKQAPEPQGGGILDTVMEYWWVGAALVVALLGFAGLRFWRSRRESSDFDDNIGRLAVAGAASVDRGFASGDTAPMRPIPAAAGDSDAFLVEESGTHERPRFSGAAAPAAPAARHVATDETISSDTAINLDQGDPLAEADFHMAYGLYDQAADLIRIAIQREPARRDLKLKLLEVFFVWGNKEQFLQTARELADSRADAAPGEWEKIVIMGKQLAPEDPLFSGGAVGSGAAAGGVDLDLEGGQSRVDFDLLGEPVPGQGGEVDLDIGSALGDADPTAESPHSATDRAVALDRAFGNSTGTTREMTARMQQEPDDLMSEFATDGPTVEQPQLNTPQQGTIRQKVEMALKKGGQEQTAELAIDDLGLDLGALDTMNQPALAASPDAPTLVAGFDERSRKIMEEAQRRASHEDKTAGTGAWQLDEAELESALANGGDDHDGNGVAASTSRLASLGSRNVDYDLSEPGMAHHHAANGAGLDLDVGSATVPDTAFTATQKLSSDDLALPDIEPVTMSEVGTKLDLARAYMDMGDPDGARNILEEVLNEGSNAQKQEAQRLMESLPG